MIRFFFAISKAKVSKKKLAWVDVIEMISVMEVFLDHLFVQVHATCPWGLAACQVNFQESMNVIRKSESAVLVVSG